MFSGKTTRLIQEYSFSEFEDHEKLAVKPLLDNRYQAHKISAHSGIQLHGHRIGKAEELYPILTPEIKEIYIDEVQFFGPNINQVISDLNFQGIRVVAAGLDRDYMGRDFGPMPQLKKQAGNVLELKAKCAVCGNAANNTYRTSDSEQLLLIGHSDSYEARCREHWEEGMKARGLI